MNELDKVNAYCYGLIHAMRGTNAETMTLTQTGVRHEGELLGDYEITVKKLST